jgi:two-component system, NarL family, sensor kinase
LNEGSILKNTDMVITLLIGMIIFILLAGFVISFVLIYQRRRAEHVRIVSQLTSAFEQETLKSQLEMQEQTLQKISEEIHDNIGQVLSLAKINLRTDGDGEQLRDRIDSSRELVGKAIADLRDLSKSMSTERIGELGLPDAIEYELAIFRRNNTGNAQLTVTGEHRRFPGQQEVMIFRMFQEMFNNSVKHSNATELQFELNYSDESLQLVARDNGKGFDLHKTPTGLGLMNLRRRAGILNGSFEIETSRGKGTVLMITVPLNKANAMQ